MTGWDELSTSKTEIQPANNWTESKTETILVYGKPKVGKTSAYMSLIDTEQKKNPETKFFLINTDNGASRTFVWYFGENREVLKSIEYYSAQNPDAFYKTITEIRKKAKPTDWIIIDLLSDLWEFSQDAFQEQIARAFGGSVTDMILSASKDPKLFGSFSGIQWQWIKRLDNIASRDLVTNPACNVFAVCSEKDISMEEALQESAIKKGKIEKKSEELSLFERIGAKPKGQKDIMYNFSTIVYIRGVEEKFYQIVGDRGKLAVGQPTPFGRNFWEIFIKNERVKK